MIKSHQHSKSLICVWALLGGLLQAAAVGLPQLSEGEAAQIVGRPLASGFKRVVWSASEPRRSNLVVYAVRPPKYDEAVLRRLAATFSVKGDIELMPADFIGAPGYWIRQFIGSNSLRWKCVDFSQLTGRIGYASGEDNHRWNIKEHKPLAGDVPNAGEALNKTLALLPLLGLTTKDLEHTADGAVRWSALTDVTRYTDLKDGKRKQYVRQMNITLWQRVPEGGSVLSVGGGGTLQAGFMSDGKLAEFEILFRNLEPLGLLPGKSKDELIAMLRQGKARTFRESLPDSLTVTNCAVVYPQGNVGMRQAHVWPFYEIKGFAAEGGETNSMSVYVGVK